MRDKVCPLNLKLELHVIRGDLKRLSKVNPGASCERPVPHGSTSGIHPTSAKE